MYHQVNTSEIKLHSRLQEALSVLKMNGLSRSLRNISSFYSESLSEPKQMWLPYGDHYYLKKNCALPFHLPFSVRTVFSEYTRKKCFPPSESLKILKTLTIRHTFNIAKGVMVIGLWYTETTRKVRTQISVKFCFFIFS